MYIELIDNSQLNKSYNLFSEIRHKNHTELAKQKNKTRQKTYYNVKPSKDYSRKNLIVHRYEYCPYLLMDR